MAHATSHTTAVAAATPAAIRNRARVRQRERTSLTAARRTAAVCPDLSLEPLISTWTPSCSAAGVDLRCRSRPAPDQALCREAGEHHHQAVPPERLVTLTIALQRLGRPVPGVRAPGHRRGEGGWRQPRPVGLA